MVSTEVEEFNRLITYLIRVKDEMDEIVVLVDESNTNELVLNILRNNESKIRYFFNPLNNDFSAQKNLLFSKCKNEIIVNLDADELISEDFILSVKEILKENPEIEAYWVPRWNEVIGLTQDFVKKWGWRLDQHNRVNWPDLQMRIVKNNTNIKWVGAVHEQLTGYSSYAILPLEREYSISHIKTLEKQISQNSRYENILNS